MAVRRIVDVAAARNPARSGIAMMALGRACLFCT